MAQVWTLRRRSVRVETAVEVVAKKLKAQFDAIDTLQYEVAFEDAAARRSEVSREPA